MTRPEIEKLVERLRAKRALDIGSAPHVGLGGDTGFGTPAMVEWFINPDGPEAADRIEALAADNARQRSLLKYALEAIETRRSEPLFAAGDSLRNYFEDAALAAITEPSDD